MQSGQVKREFVVPHVFQYKKSPTDASEIGGKTDSIFEIAILDACIASVL
jgi:hypothetical protein